MHLTRRWMAGWTWPIRYLVDILGAYCCRVTFVLILADRTAYVAELADEADELCGPFSRVRVIRRRLKMLCAVRDASDVAWVLENIIAILTRLQLRLGVHMLVYDLHCGPHAHNNTYNSSYLYTIRYTLAMLLPLFWEAFHVEFGFAPWYTLVEFVTYGVTDMRDCTGWPAPHIQLDGRAFFFFHGFADLDVEVLDNAMFSGSKMAKQHGNTEAILNWNEGQWGSIGENASAVVSPRFASPAMSLLLGHAGVFRPLHDLRSKASVDCLLEKVHTAALDEARDCAGGCNVASLNHDKHENGIDVLRASLFQLPCVLHGYDGVRMKCDDHFCVACIYAMTQRVNVRASEHAQIQSDGSYLSWRTPVNQPPSAFCKICTAVRKEEVA